MSMVATVATALQTVLTTHAEQAARDSGFRQRASKLGGAAFTQALVFGCLSTPEPTLEDWAQTAAACGVPVQPQALDQRFTAAAADCLQRVLAAAVRQVVAADPVAVPLLRRFTGVFVQDSTTIALPDALADVWPGCGGGAAREARAAVKFQVRLDLTTGRLAGPFPQPGRAADHSSPLQDGDDLPAGALRLADLGYFDLDTFERLGRRQVWWLSRWQPGTAVFDAAGRELALADWLGRQPRRARVVDVPVTLGNAKRLASRLVALRVPAAVAAKRRQRLRQKASKKGRPASAAQLALCAWSVYVTNLPVATADAAAVSVLARARWQIELLFKLWKSDAHLDESRSRQPWRVLCEVWAKMIAVVVQHWLLVASCWREPGRSLRKAAKAVRRHALAVASALRERAAVCRALAVIGDCLQAAARIAKRRGKPNTHQTLQKPTIYGTTLA